MQEITHSVLRQQRFSHDSAAFRAGMQAVAQIVHIAVGSRQSGVNIRERQPQFRAERGLAPH